MNDRDIIRSEKIEPFFEPMREFANYGHPFNWNIVIQSVQYFRSDIENGYGVFGDAFFATVLQLFEQYQCSDVSTINEIVDLYYFHNNPVWLLKLLGRLNCLVKCPKNEVSMPISILDLFTNRTAYGNIKLCRPSDPLGVALLVANEDWVNFLIKCGINYLSPAECPCEWELIAAFLGFCPFSDIVNIRSGEQLDTILSKHYFPEERKRLMIVLKGLEFLARAPFRQARPVTIRCFRKAFETVPEPYITSDEVRKLLEIIVHPTADENTVKELIVEYENSFPESCQTIRPRPLLHLSRCQIRQNLRIAGNILHGVKQLHLPLAIESYVLLQ